MAPSDDAARMAKRSKTAPTVLYHDLDLPAKMRIDATPQGGEVKYARIQYDGGHLVLQLESVTASLRLPFGIDNGSKFRSKPSVQIELPPAQLAFFRDRLEATVKDAAVTHKAVWFGAIQPLPEDDAVRESFKSRIKVDRLGKYPPTLKVNVALSDIDNKSKVQVLTCKRLADGTISNPQPATVDAVASGSRVVPVLRTAGGVWISINTTRKIFEYGIVFEVSHMVVIAEEQGGSHPDCGAEVASSSVALAEQAACGGVASPPIALSYAPPATPQQADGASMPSEQSIQEACASGLQSSQELLRRAQAHRSSVSGMLDVRSVTASGTASGTELASVGDADASCKAEDGLQSLLLSVVPGSEASPERTPASPPFTMQACSHCSKAKVSCVDGQRPCPRCLRLGVECDEYAKPVKRACTNCRRTRIKCDLGEREPCTRCARLGLTCEPHVPGPMGRKKKRGEETHHYESQQSGAGSSDSASFNSLLSQS